jgi:hypothetical protein
MHTGPGIGALETVVIHEIHSSSDKNEPGPKTSTLSIPDEAEDVTSLSPGSLDPSIVSVVRRTRPLKYCQMDFKVKIKTVLVVFCRMFQIVRLLLADLMY